MGVAMIRGLPPGGVRVARWSPRSMPAVSTGAYRSPRLRRFGPGGGGGGAPGHPAGHAPGTGRPTPGPGYPGELPGAGAGQTTHTHTPWPGATVRGACCPGGWEAELQLPLDHVVHRDPKSRRVRGRDGISLPVGEGEGGDPQGETHELEQLAGPLVILGQEGGDAVTLRGMEARDGGGLLARRTHAAPNHRQALAVQEDSDVHGPAGVRLLQGGVGDERRQAGLMRAHFAYWAIGGVGGRRFGVVIGRVRRLGGFRGAEGASVVIQETSRLGGRALGCIHINGGGGGAGGPPPCVGPQTRGRVRWCWLAHLGHAQAAAPP